MARSILQQARELAQKAKSTVSNQLNKTTIDEQIRAGVSGLTKGSPIERAKTAYKIATTPLTTGSQFVAEKTAPRLASIGKAVEQIEPIYQKLTAKPKSIVPESPMLTAGKFIGGLGASQLADYGRLAQTTSKSLTPQGRQQYTQEVKSKGLGLDSPALRDILTASDVIPGSAIAGGVIGSIKPLRALTKEARLSGEALQAARQGIRALDLADEALPAVGKTLPKIGTEELKATRQIADTVLNQGERVSVDLADELFQQADRILGKKEVKRVEELARKSGQDVVQSLAENIKAVVAEPRTTTNMFGQTIPMPDAGQAGFIRLGKAAEETKPKSAVLAKFENAIKTEQTVKPKSALAEATGQSDLVTNLKTQFWDAYEPIRAFTEGLRKKGTISSLKDPYEKAILYAGSADKINLGLEQFGETLKPIGQNLNEVRSLLVADRIPGLAKKGITEYGADLTLDEAKLVRSELRRTLGNEKYQALSKAADDVRSFNKNTLDLLRANGLMDKDTYQSIKNSEDLYAPMQRVLEADDAMESLGLGKKAFSVSKQDVVKKMTGSKKDIFDPLQATMKNYAKTVELVERNKVAKSIADLAKFDEMKDLVKVVKESDPVPVGFSKINFLDDGVKKSVVVPREVGDAMKSMNKEAIDLMTKWASKSSKLLRAGATSYNISFLLPNVVRDVTTASLISDKGVGNWLGGLASAIKKDDVYEQWIKAGGGGGTVYDIGRGGLKTLEDLAGVEPKTTLGKIGKIVTKPIQLIEELGRVSEQATRLAVFRNALDNGASMADAAMQSRNATVDFARAGTTGKVINMWVPFLNARAQGTGNLINAFKKNPKRTMARAAAIIGTPAVATWAYNQQFNDYKDIPQTEKDNYFFIITRDRTPQEVAEGAPINAIKLPKDTTGKILGNSLNAFLDFASGQDGATAQELAANILGEVSPVGLTPRQVASTLTPQFAKPVVEGVTNQNLFTGRDIEPDYINGVQRQYVPTSERTARNTGAFAKAIGPLTGAVGISPAVLENTVSTMAGGVGKQGLQVFNFLASGGKEVPKGVSEIPIAQRFSGLRSGKQEQQETKNIESFLQAQGKEKLKFNKQVESTIKELDRMTPEGAQFKFKQLLEKNPELAKKVKERKDEMKLGLTYQDTLIKKLGVENKQRATYIFEELEKLETKEERNALYAELRRKKIITDQVGDQIKALKRKKLGE